MQKESQNRTNRVYSFPKASQSDIIRAVQKDTHVQRQLFDQLYECSVKLLGSRISARLQAEIFFGAQMIYFCSTNLNSYQTLGEEYCDLLELHKFSFPTQFRRFLYGFFQIVLPYTFDKLFNRLTNWANQPSFVNNRQYRLKQLLQKYLPIVKPLLSTLVRLNLALFYFGGMYYEAGKRLFSIRYTYIGGSTQSRINYSFLGLLLILELFISIFRVLKNQFIDKNQNKQKQIEVENSISNDDRKCSLCLESMRNPTTTQCGHLFCWNCIHESCSVKQECPVCRRIITKQNLLSLSHF
eukprot:TRINITY_DN8073_c0_g1_i1.p1 TRINITY_DN8073_c0_g1~~TRINITY_DN8073_c0_g1_i1.p1  ORF type:complete len:318 (-),score=121.63 TRINITY_DN8073_c0_g1_i1:68-958(-)